jgi:hypothetical protein
VDAMTEIGSGGAESWTSVSPWLEAAVARVATDMLPKEVSTTLHAFARLGLTPGTPARAAGADTRPLISSM